MRILFYIVHPSKYHLFRYSIKELKKNNDADIIINSKDVLQNLIESENWNHYNLFPKGRNTSKHPSVFVSAFKFILTIIKLEMYLLRNQKYDLYITDDSLVVNGWYRRVRSLLFNDNDINTIKFNKILFFFAEYIISPKSVSLGRFENKKVGFKGNKAIAHLHPKYFTPDETILKKYNLIENEYGIIRLSRINATHDYGNKGITDENLKELFNLCIENTYILISSERNINSDYNKYLYSGRPTDFCHIIYFAKYLIGDSSTIATEASILGVPNILINRLGKLCSVNKELFDLDLQYMYDNYFDAKHKIKELINNSGYKEELRIKSKRFVKKCDDFNLWFLELVSKQLNIS